jgi:hypothetical protein
MLKKLKAVLLLSVIISLFISCTKDIEPVIPSDPDPIETPTPDDEIVTPDEEPNSPEEEPSEEKPTENENQKNSIEIGTGSGQLTIDGNSTVLQGKNFITIKGGTYSSIAIKNLNSTIENPIFIKNAGQVTVSGGMSVEDAINVTISGDNVPGMQYGFNLHNISYKGITMWGKLTGITLKNISFKNIGDYVIDINGSMPYLGTAETRFERFKVLNCKFDNAGVIHYVGHVDNGQDVGFMKDLEIAHNIIENSNSGSFAYIGNVQDYNIHHNTINNYNPTNNNHNGIFHMIGNGKFHNNKFTNVQGNAIRAWLYSRGNTPATVEIFNNVIYNTRKYGAFEIQGFDRYIVPGKTTFANAKVYNNTGGRLNTEKDWAGFMLDLYNYGGTLEYYNNLGFDMHYANNNPGNVQMINNMSDVKIIKNTNNSYFSTSAEAVVNLSSFKSRYPGIGADL